MSFSQWIRANSEHYLLCDAQDRVARRKGFNPPNKPRGLKDRFWRHFFVPIYHALPWFLKKIIMHSLPGSHRKAWPKKDFRSEGSR